VPAARSRPRPTIASDRAWPTTPDIDIDLAVDQLLGPIYYRVLVTGHPVPREFTDHLVHQFLIQHADHNRSNTEQREGPN
jgi:hypothetical protein